MKSRIEGKGPAAEALERFGLTARRLTSMGTEAAFMKIVEALEKVHNPAERAKTRWICSASRVKE